MDDPAATADALDRLAEQVSQVAAMLRAGERVEGLAAGPAEPPCDPWSIVDLVTNDLSRRGIKTRFGAESDLVGAARSAAQLLQALGLRPISPDEADPPVHGGVPNLGTD